MRVCPERPVVDKVSVTGIRRVWESSGDVGVHRGRGQAGDLHVKEQENLRSNETNEIVASPSMFMVI